LSPDDQEKLADAEAFIELEEILERQGYHNNPKDGPKYVQIAIVWTARSCELGTASR
jgi:hypothetical protein